MPFNLFKDANYRAPAFIQLAVKRKFNQSGIFVVGVKEEDLLAFKSRLSYHTLKIDYPVEKGKAVVAIDTRSHANTAVISTDDATGHTIDDGEEKPEDWYDEFEILSKQDQAQHTKKTYQLSLGTSTTKGANFNFQLKGAAFFNSVTPSARVGGSYSKTTHNTEEYSDESSLSVAKGYQVVDTLKVPPETKVKARITTLAVTYESKTLTEITIDEKAFLEVHYRPKLSRILVGGIWTRKVKITAKDIFCNEMDYKCEDDLISFKRVGVISYLGEEVDILKQRKHCTYEGETERSMQPL